MSTAIGAAVAELLLSTDECEMRVAVNSSLIALGLVLGIVFFAAMFAAHNWSSRRR